MERGLAETGPILAFVTGFVDTGVFVHMGGLFVAHVTGNLVLLGTALAGSSALAGHAGVVRLQLLSFPIFVIAAGLGAVLVGARPSSGPQPMLRVLWLAVIVMLIASGVALVRPAGGEAAMCLVLAMGLLNALHRLDSRLGPPFTVMTGNITSLAIAAAQKLGLAPTLPAAAGTGRTVLAVCAFALGALSGAVADRLFGLVSIVIPTFVLAGHLIFGLRLQARS